MIEFELSFYDFFKTTDLEKSYYLLYFVVVVEVFEVGSKNDFCKVFLVINNLSSSRSIGSVVRLGGRYQFSYGLLCELRYICSWCFCMKYRLSKICRVGLAPLLL